MKKYKHVKTGNIAEETNSGKNYKVFEPKHFTIPKWIIENSNEWKEVIEQTPFEVHFTGREVVGVTRLKDNVYFSKGLRVKMPGSNTLGFIYGFSLDNGILKIDHTFSFLMNQAGITDHLTALRPCLYTKEELMQNEWYN